LKYLFLTRHAKSSWANLGLADIDRPLNERGKKAALFMGKLIVNKGEKPELLISSPANRALSTAKAFGNVIGLVEDDIIIDRTKPMTFPKAFAVESARLAGLDISNSGFSPLFTINLPMKSAAFFPRSFNGRSISANPRLAQLDFACLVRNKYFNNVLSR
jgi:hypothetical protein